LAIDNRQYANAEFWILPIAHCQLFIGMKRLWLVDLRILKQLTMGVKNFRETRAYKLSFEVAMEIFEISKTFPKEETYSLTDQIRRSSRSVCANIAEAYRKKLYPAHFASKVSDADTENSETGVWLDFSIACKYISQEKYKTLSDKNQETGRLLGHMINNPEKY
jgi:four helix bundle protein